MATGVVLTPERRHATIGWAAEREGVVVEDDYDAEFRYDRQAVGSPQGLALTAWSWSGSVSKVLGPALRLGWVVCPHELVNAVTHAKRLADRGTLALDQLALARLIESGRYDRHLRRMRAVYARKREALIAALAEHAHGVELTGLAAGFHAVARLPAGSNEAAVARAARERGEEGVSDGPLRISGLDEVDVKLASLFDARATSTPRRARIRPPRTHPPLQCRSSAAARETPSSPPDFSPPGGRPLPLLQRRLEHDPP